MPGAFLAMKFEHCAGAGQFPASLVKPRSFHQVGHPQVSAVGCLASGRLMDAPPMCQASKILQENGKRPKQRAKHTTPTWENWECQWLTHALKIGKYHEISFPVNFVSAFPLGTQCYPSPLAPTVRFVLSTLRRLSLEHKKKSTKPIFGAWFTRNSDSSLGCLHRTKSEVEVVLEAPGYVKTVLPKWSFWDHLEIWPFLSSDWSVHPRLGFEDWQASLFLQGLGWRRLAERQTL